MNSDPPSDQWYENIYHAFFEEKLFPDLKIIFVWLIITITGIYLPIVNTTPFRVLFSLPLILFIPGYVLITALFPGNKDIDIIERIALSFGLSIAVVPLIGLGLNYTPFGIRLDPIVISLLVFTVVMIMISQFRRAIISEPERFQVPVHELMSGIKEEFFSVNTTKIDRILSIILLIAIIGAIGTTIFVIAVPKEGEKFSEFFILGANMKAADYPTKLYAGMDYPIYIGVGNHEFRNVTYTIELFLMNMDYDEGLNSSAISRMDRIDQIPVVLSHEEKKILPYTIRITQTGYNRVEFLLFNETIPRETVTGFDRIDASYQDLHLWVKTQQSGE